MVQVVHTDKAQVSVLNVCYAVTGALDVQLKLIFSTAYTTNCVHYWQYLLGCY